MLRGHSGFGDTATATWKSDVINLQFSKMEKWRNGEMEKWRNGEILWHKNNNNVKIEDAVRAE